MQQTETQLQQPTALAPADLLGARFCQYFSHPWKHIHRPLAVAGEKTQWITAKYFLNPRTLWQRYLDPDTIIGLRFGQTTRYCLLDVDRGSCYHPANDEAAFKSVLAALEEIGLCRPLVVRSSDSGGLHIYYFFDEPLPTFALACALWFALNDAGLRVRSGQLETFPNMKAWNSLYNGCRLPLQAGSYLLNRDLEILTNDLSQFLDAADTAAAHQDLPKLKEAIAKAEKRPKRRSTNRLPEDDAQWKAEWEKNIASGWTGSGQTNELLKLMVGYGKVFLHLGGEELVDYVEATAKAAPGYEQYCGHQHEIRQRARHWVSSTEHNEFYSEYCSYPKRRGTYKQTYRSEPANNVIRFKSNLNEQRSNEATDRVNQAVSYLKKLGKLPATVTARARAIIAAAKELLGVGISLLTLRKQSYLPLWHPRFQPCTAAESNCDSTCLEGGDVALSSNPESIVYLQQQSIQSPSRSMSEGESLATPSSSDHVDSNTSSKQVLRHDEIPSSIAASNCSTETESVLREVLVKPLPDVDSPTWITPPLVVHENHEEQKLPEPVQLLDSSSLDHTPPLMKVYGSVDTKGVPQKTPFVSPDSKTTPSVDSCCSSPRDPSTDDCHTTRHNAAVSESSQDIPIAPAALEPSQGAPAALELSQGAPAAPAALEVMQDASTNPGRASWLALGEMLKANQKKRRLAKTLGNFSTS